MMKNGLKRSKIEGKKPVKNGEKEMVKNGKQQ